MTSPESRRSMDPAPPLPGVSNVRDLGGMRTNDGGRLRPGRLFRGDQPTGEVEDLRQLVARLRLTSAVDLRSSHEQSVSPVPWSAAGVESSHVPLLSERIPDSWHARYTSYLKDSPEKVVDAVRAAINVDRYPVLVHCFAGKDRTGVVIALVLALLDVRITDIVTDYVATAPAVPELLERAVGLGLLLDDLTPELVLDQTPRADTMTAFLDYVNRKGGARAWLSQRGLEQERVDRFRVHMRSSDGIA